MASDPQPAPPAVLGHELEALADNLPNLAWIAYADGAVFWYNRAWYDYTGRSAEEMLGWGWSSVHHPAELERVTAVWVETLAQGTTAELTFPLRRHDGSFRPFLTRVIPIRDSSGKVVRWFGNSVDVTEQVETAEHLRQAGADWRNLFEEMQEGIVLGELVRDEQGNAVDARILRANHKIEMAGGIPPQDAVGLSIHGILGDPSGDLLSCFVRVVESGVSERLELRDETLDRWFEIHAYRPSPGQFAALYLDVTARKQAEQQARRAQEHLMRVSRLSAMGAMASTLSHELNQPIGAASNFLAAADEHVKRADVIDRALLRTLFESAIASCQRAGQIIRSMREFTASGTVTKTPEQLCDMIDASVEEYLGGAGRGGLSFAVDCPRDLPPLQCDRTQIIQVLINLYTNSARAMADLPHRRITVSACSTPGSHRVRVEDNGPGFGDRSLQKLFEPFWSTTDVGLGLGLPLCRTIVEAHGGTIRAESGAGGGAAFLIELPLIEP